MSGGDWKSMFNAVQIGDYSLTECYLRVGIDPNYQPPEVMAAPLVEAVRCNHLEIVKLLLENGADPEIKEIMGGDTPQSVAYFKNNKEAIDLLNVYLNK